MQIAGLPEGDLNSSAFCFKILYLIHNERRGDCKGKKGVGFRYLDIR